MLKTGNSSNKKYTIYIVLSFTGTILSRIVRLFTKDEYCHSSLSLDKELNEMYSFGRLNPYNPFIGGFVHENPKWGTFKRFKNTKAKIISLDVSEYQYKKIKKIIEKINNKKDLYSFNILGLVGVKLHKKYKKQYRFYCAEFVKFLIDESHIENNLPELIKPQDFELLESETIFQGLLREYNINS